MKPCQLCGAKSWGQIPYTVDQPIADSQQAFLAGKDASQYRRCDGCGAFASLVQMALEDPPRRDPVEASLHDPVAAVLANFKPHLPVPETRLERLVRAMLQSGSVHKDFIGPRDVVGYAQVIESELDTPAGAEDPVEGSLVWHAHEWNFKDREALLQWLIQGLDAGREHLIQQQIVCELNINRMAAALILWMESGGPRG